MGHRLFPHPELHKVWERKKRLRSRRLQDKWFYKVMPKICGGEKIEGRLPEEAEDVGDNLGSWKGVTRDKEKGLVGKNGRLDQGKEQQNIIRTNVRGRSMTRKMCPWAVTKENRYLNWEILGSFNIVIYNKKLYMCVCVCAHTHTHTKKKLCKNLEICN